MNPAINKTEKIDAPVEVAEFFPFKFWRFDEVTTDFAEGSAAFLVLLLLRLRPLVRLG